MPLWYYPLHFLAHLQDLNIAETQLSIALNKLILKAVNTNIFVIIRPTDSIDISRLTEGVRE